MKGETFVMKEPLAVYLEDHLAGAQMAIDVLEDMRDEYAGEPLSQFAGELLVDIKKDQEILRDLAQQVGGDRSDPVKEALAWVGEKVTRVKLRRRAGGGLGTYLSLETLALGILGKLSLWEALAEIDTPDHRLRGVDFNELAERARTQHARVKDYRLAVARDVFADSRH